MQFKRNLSNSTKWASKLKVYFKLKLCCSNFVLQLSFAYNPAFYFNNGKNYEGIYDSSPHVSLIARNILIVIVRFACYQHHHASNSTFMTDSMYLGTIQICQNLNTTTMNTTFI